MGTGQHAKHKGANAKVKKYKRKVWLSNRDKDLDQIQDEFVKAETTGKPLTDVAFDDELYSSRGDGGRASSLIAAATSAVAASSRMIRWPLLGALLLLALRQAHPIVVPLLKSLIQSYDRSMMARPLITKVMTGAVLATLGDALAQSKTARSSTATASTA